MSINEGPIQQSTVLELNSTGHLISQWGKNMYDQTKYHNNVMIMLSSRFYMPHGLTIDSQGNYWITDVAMHQVSQSVFAFLYLGTTRLVFRFSSLVHTEKKYSSLVLHFLREMTRVTFANLLLLPWMQKLGLYLLVMVIAILVLCYSHQLDNT